MRVVTCIDFRDSSKLGIRTKDEIDSGSHPLELVRSLIAPLEHVLALGGLLPLRVHAKQGHEEIIGQGLGSLGEDSKFGLPDICIQDAQAADKHRHLGSGKRQHLRPIHQQFLRRSLMFVSKVVTESVCCRFENGKRIHIGLLLQRVRAPRRERNLQIMPGILRSSFDGRATAQNDHISK